MRQQRLDKRMIAWSKQMKFIAFILGFSLLFFNVSNAKENEYPDAVWVNLDIDYDTQDNDDQMYDYLYKYKCPNPHFLGGFVDNADTSIIDIDLVKSAFVKKNANALVKLGRELVTFKTTLGNSDDEGDATPFGLDGIIVYSSKPKPRFMSLTTPRNYKHKIKTFYIKNVNDKASIQDAFCKAVPHYTGIPQ